jgi:hypothetical protein
MSDFQNKPPGGGCPGSSMQQFKAPTQTDQSSEKTPSQLAQWPVQLMLVPPNAPYFQDAELALTADCIPFAYADYHKDYLKGRPIAVACPKLDNLEFYIEKLTEIIKLNNLKGIEVLVMEVPCCSGLFQAAQMARTKAGVDLPIKITTIGVRGENFGTQIV